MVGSEWARIGEGHHLSGQCLRELGPARFWLVPQIPHLIRIILKIVEFAPISALVEG
jgi:hypothetical protein